jgi:hypothetical protein
MTLIAAIVAGLACGYALGFRPRALAVFLLGWIAVLAVQTWAVLDPKDVPPQAWEYVPVQVVILALGVAMIWIGAKIRARRAPSPPLG